MNINYQPRISIKNRPDDILFVLYFIISSFFLVFYINEWILYNPFTLGLVLNIISIISIIIGVKFMRFLVAIYTFLFGVFFVWLQFYPFLGIYSYPMLIPISILWFYFSLVTGFNLLFYTKYYEISSQKFREKYGPWALVVGASEGLGYSWSVLLAKKGCNLVIVARRPELLETTASTIRKSYNVEVNTVVCDMDNSEAFKTINDAIKNIDVGFMVFNAASAPISPFHFLSFSQVSSIINVNILTTVLLTRELFDKWDKNKNKKGKGYGGILFVGSLSGQQGTALVQTYAATKGFLRLLAEGLGFECLHYKNATVRCCVAGEIATPAYIRQAETLNTSLWFAATPDQIASTGIASFSRHQTVVIGTLFDYIIDCVFSLLPRYIRVKIFGSAMRNKFKDAEKEKS